MDSQMSVPTDRGHEFPSLSRSVTQDRIDRYADASGDHNPLHVDPDFAARTQFGGTIAHGMLVLAYMSEALTSWFGSAWLNNGRLKSRFRAPARMGNTITITGFVTRSEAGMVACTVEARNESGEILVSSESQVGP